MDRLTASCLWGRQSRQPGLFGSLVTSPTEIHNNLTKFKAALLDAHNDILPRLYFVKVDVKACFDTINQQTLLTILATVLQEVSQPCPNLIRPARFSAEQKFQFEPGPG